MESLTIKDNMDYLRQVSSEISIFDSRLGEYISILDEYCESHKVMVMAAVQLGIPYRIVYLKNTDLSKINDDIEFNEKRVLINPVIIKRFGLTEYWEACASCLNFMGRVLRPYRIKIMYYDTNGNKCFSDFVGFEATVLSHEMDHLDGILHMDKALEVLEMERDERKKFRETHPYKIYRKNLNYEDLCMKYDK